MQVISESAGGGGEQTRTCSLDGAGGVVTVGVLNVLNIEGRVIPCLASGLHDCIR